MIHISLDESRFNFNGDINVVIANFRKFLERLQLESTLENETFFIKGDIRISPMKGGEQQ